MAARIDKFVSSLRSQGEWHRKMYGACDPAPVTSTMAAELRDIVNFDDCLGKVDLAKLMGEGWPRNPNPQDPSLACICQVLCDADALATVRSIEPFKPQNLDLLLGKLQRGELLLEESTGGKESTCLGRSGFFTEECLLAGGVAIASIPRKVRRQYKECLSICLNDGMSWCAVSESHYGQSWILVWLRNIVRALRGGASLLVLVPKAQEQLGSAQRAEVALLLALELPFAFAEIDEFIANRRPLHHLAEKSDWAKIESVLDARHVPGALEAMLRKPSADGRTVLHCAVEHGGPAHLIQNLIAKRADVTQRTSRGQTALHLCAERQDHASQPDTLEKVAVSMLKASNGIEGLADDRGNTASCIAKSLNNLAVLKALAKQPGNLA